jgi:thiol-disulfide isomerase/thioredoxin
VTDTDTAGAAGPPTDHRPDATRRLLLWGTLGAVVLAAAAAAVTAVVLDDGDDPDDAAGPEMELVEGDTVVGLDGTVTYTTFDGEEASTDRYLGRPLVVNFWASWCAPCVAEMPDFEAVHQRLGDQVAFLGLNLRDPVDEALALAERTGVTYDLGRDPDGSLLSFYGGLGMPTTVFLDAEGTVVEVHSGALDAAQLEARIAPLLG